MRLRISRIQCKRTIISLDCIDMTAGSAQGIATVMVECGDTGIEVDGALEIRQRLLLATSCLEHVYKTTIKIRQLSRIPLSSRR